MCKMNVSVVCLAAILAGAPALAQTADAPPPAPATAPAAPATAPATAPAAPATAPAEPAASEPPPEETPPATTPAPEAAPADAPPPELGTAPAETPAPVAKPAEQDTVGKLRDYFLTRPNNAPSRLERLIIAGVASVVAVGSLAAGVALGVWAFFDYRCLTDVSACNASRPDNQKVTGSNFLRFRAEGERKALFADMGYLAAATFALVTVLLVASAFWPAGWWPFATDDAPPVEVVPPQQVITELPPPPAPEAAPAPETAPAPAPAPETAPAPAPAPEPAPSAPAPAGNPS